ncbi:GerMN domain-containing protein [Clostridium tertium]|uniref:GerMN domain-containing protein n=1 Tax=Clostridium tertium TaxID=1559 RepID=UPI0024B3C3FA|nr:GerMN domain-containing protein [Clostridium tertium]MDI9215346.1 GerMN domain-containing protein [Clostridium tertium]
MKKRILAILISLSIPFSMISCGAEANSNKNNTASNISNNEATLIDEEDNINDNTQSDKYDISNSNETITDNANIYYYDVVTDKIVYISKTIEIKDKAVATALVKELKKAPSEEIASALNSDISLNSAKVDSENDTIKLDFSSNFVEAQNLGSGPESSTLTAICNTFGDYFNVSKVIITLDGKPYTSGHISMKDGDIFKVNLDNTFELTK